MISCFYIPSHNDHRRSLREVGHLWTAISSGSKKSPRGFLRSFTDFPTRRARKLKAFKSYAFMCRLAAGGWKDARMEGRHSTSDLGCNKYFTFDLHGAVISRVLDVSRVFAGSIKVPKAKGKKKNEINSLVRYQSRSVFHPIYMYEIRTVAPAAPELIRLFHVFGHSSAWFGSIVGETDGGYQCE